MAGFIEGGTNDCVKCGSYRVRSGKCESCNTNQLDYERKKMVDNLIKYGFVEVKPFFNKSFFGIFKKQLSTYKLGDIIAYHIEDSPNMTIKINDDEHTFNKHGYFTWVKKELDKIILNKETQRELKLRQLLG